MSRYSKEILAEAKKLGIEEFHLDRYYNRGMMAWVDYKNELPPGITPEKLGIVVVEEFLESEKSKKTVIKEEPKEEFVVQEHGESLSTGAHLFGEEFVSLLPEDESIREWATSQNIQESYVKRYGAKAEEKLVEAAKLFVPKQSKSFVSESKPGSKRYNWELKKFEENNK